MKRHTPLTSANMLYQSRLHDIQERLYTRCVRTHRQMGGKLGVIAYLLLLGVGGLFAFIVLNVEATTIDGVGYSTPNPVKGSLSNCSSELCS